MSEEKIQVSEISEIIKKDFDKAGITSIIASKEIDNLDQLKQQLKGKITELLDKNYEKLINILYRIDINEDKLNELFGSRNRDNIPDRLADLIIERQLQKISIRNRYKTRRKNLPEE
ncbi:MAG TPA: hypothetical protein VI230_03905 [Ignavibacteriaceae bacterium]